MTVLVRQTRMLAACLVVIVLLTSLGGLTANAQHRSRRRHGNQHSKLKGALIGGAVGTIGGALIGHGKGALIGGGLGAGTGYLIQRHRNRGHHRRYYRRH